MSLLNIGPLNSNTDHMYHSPPRGPSGSMSGFLGLLGPILKGNRGSYLGLIPRRPTPPNSVSMRENSRGYIIKYV